MTSNPVKPHWSVFAVAAVALIWNGLGSLNFIMQLNPDALASMPESHRAIAESRPFWATLAFAVSVFGGEIGAVLLILRNPAAVNVFAASFAAVIITMIHAVGMADAASMFHGAELVLAVIMPVVFAVFLFWFALRCRKKGWIG